MKGNILRFDADNNMGAISGQDGRRYNFGPLDWHGASLPIAGVHVDFVPSGDQATQIYLADMAGDPGAGDTAKLVYILYLVSLAVGITSIVGVILAM